MSDAPIRVTVGADHTVITLDRPEVLNALDPAMHIALEEAFDRFAADDSQRVAIVRGAGRAFCAGTDLKAAAALHAAGRDNELTYPPHGYAGLIERFDLTKPIIAAVDGIAYGGGFEIVLACDIVIATSRARFALPEPLVGAVALAGGVHRLVRQIGLKPAMAIALTGAPVSAAEGHRLSFVNQVVEPDELDDAVRRWTEAIIRAAPAAVGATKEMAMRGLDEPTLAAAIRGQREYGAFRAWRASGEVWEGARAFAEKRPPSWTSE